MDSSFKRQKQALKHVHGAFKCHKSIGFLDFVGHTLALPGLDAACGM